MTEEPLALAVAGISADDWQRTPMSVKRLLMALAGEVAELKQRMAVLEELPMNYRSPPSMKTGRTAVRSYSNTRILDY